MNKKNYIIYCITVNGIIRYIGFTDDFKRRQRQHIKGIEKNDKKLLYAKINELYWEDANPEIIFNIVREFNHKGDAKRYEAYLILKDYFKEKQLWQSFPISIKYF